MSNNSLLNNSINPQKVFYREHWGLDANTPKQPRAITKDSWRRYPALGSRSTGKAILGHFIPQILDGKLKGVKASPGESLDPYESPDRAILPLGMLSLVMYDAEILGPANLEAIWDPDNLFRTEDKTYEGIVRRRLNFDAPSLMHDSTSWGMRMSQQIVDSKKPQIILYRNYHGAPAEVSYISEKKIYEQTLRYIRVAGFLIALQTFKGELCLRGAVPRRTKNFKIAERLVRLRDESDNHIFNHSSVVGEVNYSEPEDWNGVPKITRIRSAVVFHGLRDKYFNQK